MEPKADEVSFMPQPAANKIAPTTSQTGDKKPKHLNFKQIIEQEESRLPVAGLHDGIIKDD